MPDTPATATALTSTPAPTAADPSVSKLIGDAAVTVQDVKSAIAAYKSGGIAAVAAQAPTLVPHIRDIVADAEAAVPAIKAGYKTTEFWLIAAFGLANALIPLFTGKPLPMNTDAVLAAVIGVYTAARALIKK